MCLWPRMWSVMVTIPCELEKKVPSALVGLIIIGVHNIRLTDGVKFSQVLTNFLPVGPVPFWKRGVDVSKYNSGFIFFSWHCCQFLPYIFWCPVSRYVLKSLFSWRINPFSTMQCPLLLITLLTLKSALSDINTATPIFFRLVLYVFLHTFTFNLYTSLYLKWFLVDSI